MNKEIELNLFQFADKLALEHLKRLVDQGNLPETISINVAAHVLSFCFWAAYFYSGHRLSHDDHNEFLEKAANYILAEVMAVKVKGFVLTTPDYREKILILRPFMYKTSEQMLLLFDLTDLEEVRREARRCGTLWLRNYIGIESALKLSTLSEKEKDHIVKNWETDFVELRRSGERYRD